MLRNFIQNFESGIDSRLIELFESVPEYEIKTGEPLVIFSDLHIGNGRKNDDFKKNAKLFMSALNEYYLPGNFKLILNGDIEELQKFRMKSIISAWKELFVLIDKFALKGKLIKLTGNHDYSLHPESAEKLYSEQQAVRFRIAGQKNSIFIFHGHQASNYYQYFNKLNTFLLRYIVNPLGVKNFSKKLKHQKKIKIEKRVYNFSYKHRIISIIGHTHRPLFESLSKADSLRFAIETLLRRYRKAGKNRKKEIAEQIGGLKQRYDKYSVSGTEHEPAALLYSNGIPVPCLFNTGCVIGKRGISGIEITSEKIALVHWFDSRISNRFLSGSAASPEPLSGSPHIYRVVLKEDSLDYIHDSINLLTAAADEEKEHTTWNFSNFYSSSKQKLTIPC